jgi:TfoX/Sxy family transcriptional regulator of competence genes
MFGYPAAFINGHMFAGLYQDGMVVKLPASARAKLLALPGAAPFEPMPGRVMGEFVMVPPSLARDPAALRPWLEEARDYGKTRPPKAKKKRGRAG